MTLTTIAVVGILLGFVVILMGFAIDERQHPPRKRIKKHLRHKAI